MCSQIPDRVLHCKERDKDRKTIRERRTVLSVHVCGSTVNLCLIIAVELEGNSEHWQHCNNTNHSHERHSASWNIPIMYNESSLLSHMLYLFMLYSFFHLFLSICLHPSIYPSLPLFLFYRQWSWREKKSQSALFKISNLRLNTHITDFCFRAG